jgi:hypothetical protein
MDFLGNFAFRTGVPFGYLIGLVGLLVLSGAGLCLLVRGVSARPVDYFRAFVGVALLAVIAFFIVANVVYADALDVNPFATGADVAGEWRLDGARLSLHRDGTYECEGFGECNPFAAAGRWRLEDGTRLAFERVDGQQASQKLVRYFGHLRLTDSILDPDIWDGRLTFQHVETPNR